MRKPRNWNIGITFAKFKIQRLHPMIPKHVLFIINPISGTRRKRSIPSLIQKHLDHTRFTHEVCFTEHAGHATEIAAQAAADGVDIVVAVGGDGTINEVARSLVHTKTALAIIPCGSGNGLARHLELPQNARGAIDIINKDTVHCLDYGMLNDHPFFCTCGMGFDAFVSQKFAESGKRGLVQYAKNTIGIGLTYKGEHYIVDYGEGPRELDAFVITCANASQYGNNAYIAPSASMKDGMMDLIIINPINPVEGAQVLLQMFTKTLLHNHNVSLYKCTQVHITREKEGAVHCDGEAIMMGREIDVRLIPHSLNVVVNPQAHHPRPNVIQELGERIDSALRQNTAKDSAPATPEGEADTYELQRFIKAQESAYARALKEVRNGRKITHWMWYIFPQLAGLGTSQTSRYYAISGRLEAKAYLMHPILGHRLTEVTLALMAVEGRTAQQIFGAIDAAKLRSSLTLFSSISEEGNIYEKALNKYFDGKPCTFTLRAVATEK